MNRSRFGGRPVQIGKPGSHVTTVEDVDPEAGTFTALGGNQGAI